MRIGIIGAGVAGLTAAHLLSPHHDVHLFEAAERPGGHANTVEVEVDGRTVPVDTGFLVYNDRTYPGFIALLNELKVATHESDMSFSLRDEVTGLEWCGTSPGTVFAQRKNLVNPRFLQMLVDVVRFNRLAHKLLNSTEGRSRTLEDFLGAHRFSQAFRDYYLVPMGSAIWSADPGTFTQMPARTFMEFFERHGLLSLGDQPKWRTITGGSQSYVEAICQPLRTTGRLKLGVAVTGVVRRPEVVEVVAGDRRWEFDHVVLACHSDEALGLLEAPTPREVEVLHAIRYQPNVATLHTDGSMLPRAPSAGASWNYHRLRADQHLATLTYDLNRLQGLGLTTPMLVTLNRHEEIDPTKVLGRFDYAHPVLDARAIAAQSSQLELSAEQVSFCGAYWDSGFHEDGVQSARAICQRLVPTP